MSARILVVDDKRDLARGIALVLGKLPAEIAVAYSAEEALERLEQNPADVVLSDIRMPGRDGLWLLDCVRERWPQTRVILFTGYGTIDSAGDAMKRGAFDYLTKPFNNDELLVVTKRALNEIQDEQEIARALKARFVVFQTPASFYPNSDHLRDMYRFFKPMRRAP